MGRRKRRAAIARAQSRRKAKAECRHPCPLITLKDSGVGIFAIHCKDCGARLSLGPSNDDVPADEMVVAGSAWLRAGFDGWSDGLWTIGADHGWPWDPTRPVAGQYFEWLNRTGVCYPGDDGCARTRRFEVCK